MNLNIKTQALSITPAIKAYITKRIAPLEKFLNPSDTSAIAYVELGKSSQHHKSGHIFHAQAEIRVARKLFNAKADGETLYSAIDEMKEELEREITSWKDKRRSKLRKGRRSLKSVVRGDSQPSSSNDD